MNKNIPDGFKNLIYNKIDYIRLQLSYYYDVTVMNVYLESVVTFRCFYKNYGMGFEFSYNNIVDYDVDYLVELIVKKLKKEFNNDKI